MTPKYRNNHKGSAAFKSFIPPKMYDYCCDSPEIKPLTDGVTAKFSERRSPVWIGKKGCGIADATFIPPIDEELEDGLTDLENSINYSDGNIFVKAALIHYQFEMLHPFIDANGRVGRILNALFLKENKVLNHPTLLLSKELLSTEKLYNEKIQSVNDGGDINDWIIYFLKILNLAAESTIASLK